MSLNLPFRFFERVCRFLQLHVIGGDGRIFHTGMAGCQIGFGADNSRLDGTVLLLLPIAELFRRREPRGDAVGRPC